MFIKSLTIRRDEELIREILFHKGLNLIVDETLTRDRKESGNNVGKTTVLRLVNFCLGGDGENIYKDPEFKGKKNSQVESFLKGSNVNITLVLIEEIDNEKSPKLVIRRNFLSRKDKILEVNGEKQKVKDFPVTLKNSIFKTKDDKPTLKQIVAKNIRDEKNRLTNTLKVLNPYTTIEEYEALYLFWLGIDLDTNSRKQKLLRDLNTEKNLIKRFKNTSSYSQITQSLLIVNRRIEGLVVKRSNLGVSNDYAEVLHCLSEVKAAINLKSNNISILELRRNLILESKKELDTEYSCVDTQQVRFIYEEAKIFMPDLQKSFEETVDFHNRMIANKLSYITAELPNLELGLNSDRRKLAGLLTEENKLALTLKKTGFVEGVQLIIEDLNVAHETKGSLEEQKRLWDHSTKRVEAIENELSQINAGIESKDEMIQTQIAEFNKFFSEISHKLYGESFVLSSDKHDKGYQLDISSISGNLGTGKKKGQIAAFDLAYIQFADSQGIECLHFILQDQIENVHDNQLSSILTEIVASTNCQYILPVLRDKLPEDILVDDFEVVALSQKDRLFRI